MPSVPPIGQLARRARILRRWADLIEGHSVELGQIESLGSIGPIKGVIDVDIPYAADCIRFFPGGRKISFTGTTKTGAAIMVASTESGIKLVTLELGGKSPNWFSPTRPT